MEKKNLKYMAFLAIAIIFWPAAIVILIYKILIKK